MLRGNFNLISFQVSIKDDIDFNFLHTVAADVLS